MNLHTVLVLEDEAIIAMDLEMTLQSHGFTVLGPCKSVTAARAAVHQQKPSVALLDVNLGAGENSFPLALELHAMGVPVIFLSGYSENVVPAPEELGGAKRFSKPVEDLELVKAVKDAVAG